MKGFFKNSLLITIMSATIIVFMFSAMTGCNRDSRVANNHETDTILYSSGGGGDEEPPAHDTMFVLTSGAEIYVKEGHYMQNDTVHLTIDIRNYSTWGNDRFIKLGATMTDTTHMISWGEMSTSSGLLAGVEVECDTAHDTWLRIFEHTPLDSLELSYIVESNRVTESYNLNGDTATYEYDNLSDSIKESLIDEMLAVYPSQPDYGRFPTSHAEYLGEMYDLYTWYDDSTSLHGNANGDLLVELIGDEDFQDWLKNEYAPSYQDDYIAQEVCAIAGLVASTKCWFGGPANFICVAATGVSIACALATIASWIIGS